MNRSPRRFTRWPCELEPADIDAIRRLAEANSLSYAEMTRRLVRHSLRCTRFDPRRALAAPERNGKADKDQ